MNNRMKIALFQRIFPHYRRPIFHELAKLYDFRLYHGIDSGNIPQTTGDFSVVVKNFYFRNFTYQSSILSVCRLKPAVIIQEFSISFFNLYVNLVIAKILRAKFVLWGHGYDRVHGFNPSDRFSDKLRLFFIKHADACILYSDEVKLELQNIVPGQIFSVARNSIDSVEKENIYARLISKKKIEDDILKLCFVARLSENKKTELLSTVAVLLKNKKIPFLITIVGDGECKDALINQCRADGVLDNFHFLGSVYEEERVAEVIFGSDFMVIPAWCGLSINHAFCYATPLATLSNQQHPPEIQFARDGYNAVLASSVQELVERMVDVKSEQNKIESMRSNARSFYEQQLSISAMLKGFTDAISGNS